MCSIADKRTADLKIVINALSARQGGGQTYLSNLLESIPADMHAKIFVLAPQSFRLRTEDQRIARIPAKWPMENPFARAAWENIYLPRLIRYLGAEVLFCPGGVVSTEPPNGCKVVTVSQNMLP